MRDAIGRVPYIVKIGHLPERDLASELLAALSPFIDALSMTNCIATTVQTPTGEKLFGGAKRGIGGEASREASIAQIRMMKTLIDQQATPLDLIGVGGIFTAAHVQEYLQAGAHAVQIATGAMLHPDLAIEIRRALA